MAGRPGVSRLVGLDHPGLVPATLLAADVLPPEDPGRVSHRTARDWLVDIVFCLASLGFAALIDLSYTGERNWLFAADVVSGIVCSLLLWTRRQWLLPLAVIATVASAYSTSSALAAAIVLFSVAVHRRTVVAFAFGGANLVASFLYLAIRPDKTAVWVAFLFSVLVIGVIVAWGMFVRARRQLVWSLRERAVRAERDQELHADRARTAERARIAREMHDVLAHRISLIALHAGGLEVSPDLSADEVRRSAGVVRATARQALEELRGVIGVLRDPGSSADEAPQAPQPTLSDLARLVEEFRAAGNRVDLTLHVAARDDVPAALGRDAFRIVQEALTNAAKHARGASAEVLVDGGPGDGLLVEVRNRLPIHASAPAIPGSGVGLVGLRERVTLAGGTLAHGPDAAGDFVVSARLGWPVLDE